MFDYLFGLGLFGLVYWLLNGILVELRVLSATGDVYTLANFLWAGALVVYLIFGIFWMVRKLKEWDIRV